MTREAGMEAALREMVAWYEEWRREEFSAEPSPEFDPIYFRALAALSGIVDECEGCGEPLEIGVVHDCPVLGTEVRVEWVGHGPDSLAESGDSVT